MNKRIVPATIDEFREQLAQDANILPKRLQQCALYVSQNIDIIAVSTIADLSQATGVQPSAFIRFCQHFGFSGFSEMRRLFRDEHSRSRPDYPTRLKNLKAVGEGSPGTLLADFVDAGRKSLENMVTTVNLETLENAVSVLSYAPMIHIVGYRRAYPVACYLAYAMDKMNIPAVLHDGAGGIEQHQTIRPKDVVIAITFSPYSAETLNVANFASGQSSPIVAITDASSSAALKFDAHILTVSEFDVGAFRSLAASMSLAMALSVAIAAKRGKKDSRI